jgi:hypothetical protein
MELTDRQQEISVGREALAAASKSAKRVLAR